MEIIDLILFFEFNPIFGSILILRGLSRDLGVSHTFILRTRGGNIYSLRGGGNAGSRCFRP